MVAKGIEQEAIVVTDKLRQQLIDQITKHNLRIAFSGTFCSGKTTVAKRLIKTLFPDFDEEKLKGKTMEEQTAYYKKVSGDGIKLIISSERFVIERDFPGKEIGKLEGDERTRYQEALLAYQIEEENGGGPTITETSANLVEIYCPDLETIQKAEKYMKTGPYNLIVHCSPEGVPFRADGERHTDKEYRLLVDQKLRQQYTEKKYDNIPVVILTGIENERNRKVVETILNYGKKEVD